MLGESLAHKIVQGLLPPRQAAELTRKVAEAVAYAVRWCEILLNRELDVVALLDQPPPAVLQWTRDVAAPPDQP